MEDSLTVILVFNRETKKTTIIFTCMQIASTIGGPKSSNRTSGKMYIPFIHELVSVFLDLSGAKNRTKQNNLHTSLFEILLMSGRFFFLFAEELTCSDLDASLLSPPRVATTAAVVSSNNWQ